MNYIDLVSLLKAYNPKGVEKCIVYGKAVKVVDRPANIFDNVHTSKTGIFVEVQCFAVNLGYHGSFLKDNGIKSKDDIYMVNGSIITFIESGIDIPDWYAFRGTLRFGTKDLSNTYVGLLTYFKDDDGWQIKPSSVSDIDMSLFDESSDTYKYLDMSLKEGRLVLPSEVLSLPQFRASSLSMTNAMSAPVSKNSRVAKSFVREDRRECKEANDLLKKFQDSLQVAKSRQNNFLDSVISEYKRQETSALVFMLNALVDNLKHKNAVNSSTGRSLIKGYLSNFKGSSTKYLGKSTIAEVLSDVFADVSSYMLDHEKYVPVEGKAWELCKIAFGNNELFYAGILAEITGVSFDELHGAVGKCNNLNISFITVINKNPYLLQFLCGLSFSSIDRIAMCYGKTLDKGLDVYRNMSILNEYINTNGSSTLYTKSGLSRSDLGITITRNNFESLKRNGTYLPLSVQANAHVFLSGVGRHQMGYLQSGFSSCYGGKYIRRFSNADLLKTIDDYINNGLGVVEGDYVTSYSLLNQELFVFESMYKMGKTRFDYDEEVIDKYIDEYERDVVGFKLEDKQREAVHLVISGAFLVAGCAGSGKTTVSRCILYVLERLEPNLELRFAAPTGKAAKHMQEVIKRQVKTLHSEFKIGISVEDDEYSEGSSGVAYFIDEGAMISLNLMYKALKHIDSRFCRVYLFGDFCQLSPIGKGLPFRNLLRFMPCVFLNVSKRASDGSEITRNSKYINENSESYNWRDLESGGDFRLMECKSDKIQRYVYDICAYYLGKKSDGEMTEVLNLLGEPCMPNIDVGEDDIQVVTPLSKASYAWGATAMNKMLKPLFNPVRSYESNFIYQLTEKVEGTLFSIGDRVIHTDKNMYNMQWYSDCGGGTFQKVYGYGICNGEVGKVLGFYSAEDTTIVVEADEEPEDFLYPDSLRDDTTWKGDGKYFVAVEYYDYLEDRNIVILYRAEINMFISSNRGTVFKGDDLSRLNLFYAGTTHKLQGSEAKLVIFPLDTVSYSGFITREMLYTMITRGSTLVIGVGSVGSSKFSMVSRARCDLASADVLTVGEVLYE